MLLCGELEIRQDTFQAITTKPGVSTTIATNTTTKKFFTLQYRIVYTLLSLGQLVLYGTLSPVTEGFHRDE
jgi:hypothetical protein